VTLVDAAGLTHIYTPNGTDWDNRWISSVSVSRFADTPVVTPGPAPSVVGFEFTPTTITTSPTVNPVMYFNVTALGNVHTPNVIACFQGPTVSATSTQMAANALWVDIQFAQSTQQGIWVMLQQGDGNLIIEGRKTFTDFMLNAWGVYVPAGTYLLQGFELLETGQGSSIAIYGTIDPQYQVSITNAVFNSFTPALPSPAAHAVVSFGSLLACALLALVAAKL